MIDSRLSIKIQEKWKKEEKRSISIIYLINTLHHVCHVYNVTILAHVQKIQKYII
jgi:hypothetical protein